MIIAIDPGKTTGWAVFEGLPNTGGIMKACGICSDLDGVALNGIIEGIIELPKSRHDTPNPNSLITLAVRIGEYKAELKRAGVAVQLVFPEEWKGQTPKDVSWRRALAKLKPGEITSVAAAKKGHKKVDDLEDAIALGLWFVGR